MIRPTRQPGPRAQRGPVWATEPGDQPGTVRVFRRILTVPVGDWRLHGVYQDTDPFIAACLGYTPTPDTSD